MRFNRKTALIGAIAACLTVGLSGAASAATQPTRAAAAVSANASSAEAEPGDVQAQGVYHTFHLSNQTGEDLTLTKVDISDRNGGHRSYEDAIAHEDGRGLWLPKVGDVLKASEYKLYGVTYWFSNTPQVSLTFEDKAGHKVTYKSESNFVGGGAWYQDNPEDHFKVAEPAGSSTLTWLTIVNR